MQRITEMLALYREIRADLKKGRARDVGAWSNENPRQRDEWPLGVGTSQEGGLGGRLAWRQEARVGNARGHATEDLAGQVRDSGFCPAQPRSHWRALKEQ